MSGPVYGALSRQRNTQKYGAATLSFSIFGWISPEIIHNLGHAPCQLVTNPVVGRKISGMSFEGAPTFRGSALCTVTSLLAVICL